MFVQLVATQSSACLAPKDTAMTCGGCCTGCEAAQHCQPDQQPSTSGMQSMEEEAEASAKEGPTQAVPPVEHAPAGLAVMPPAGHVPPSPASAAAPVLGPLFPAVSMKRRYSMMQVAYDLQHCLLLFMQPHLAKDTCCLGSTSACLSMAMSFKDALLLEASVYPAGWVSVSHIGLMCCVSWQTVSSEG